MNTYFEEFYTRWNEKVSRIDGNQIDSIFDKYFTLYVIFNNLYIEIPAKLISENKYLPNEVSDKNKATGLVLMLLSPSVLSNALQQY